MPGDPSENEWEQFAREWLGELGWELKHGTELAPQTDERTGWDELLLRKRLTESVRRLNPRLPETAVLELVQHFTRHENEEPISENFRVHELLRKGIQVSYVDEEGWERDDTVWVLDAEHPDRNEFVLADQVTLKTRDHQVRFDLVAYVNGLPLAVFELKKAGSPDATSEGAYHQLRKYLHTLKERAFAIPSFCVVSDGISAYYGTIFTPWQHFAPWNVDDDGERADKNVPALETLVPGLFERHRFLDLVTHFVSFSTGKRGSVDTKLLAKPHQYFAVNKAVAETVKAVATTGRIGVVWHTQGSGKSKEMEFYTQRLLEHPQLGNPTVVVLSDRTDLDDQLFRTFAASKLLGDEPKQVADRDELRRELSGRAGGGILFTTLQKFDLTEQERKTQLNHPELSTRVNIVVIADEAHRSHYGLTKGLADNLRRALPNASFIAFTGTPVTGAHNTQAVFGSHIHTYDLTMAVADGATVPVYYENAHIPMRLSDGTELDVLDEQADIVTEGLTDFQHNEVQQLHEIDLLGVQERIERVAEHVVAHWETRRSEIREHIGDHPGKGMIVGASRDICARLYQAIIDRRPDWHDDDHSKGVIKVVYRPGDTNEGLIANHLYSDKQLREIQARIKDETDPLELVIVQAMLQTGFDAPPLHTLYVDNRMRGANLMQAIARVNRRFDEKPGGLIVDYVGLSNALTAALADYTKTDQDERPLGKNIDEAAKVVRCQHELLCEQLHGTGWRDKLAPGTPYAYATAALAAANHLLDPEHRQNRLAQDDSERRTPTASDLFVQTYRTLSRAFSLAGTHRDVEPLRNDIRFFQAVRVYLVKREDGDRKDSGRTTTAEMAAILRKITAEAVVTDDIVDIYSAAGLEKPDLSHLDDEYLEQLRASKHPHLMIEALRKLLLAQITKTAKQNVVQRKKFSEELTAILRRYTNNALGTAEVLGELFGFARTVVAEDGRADELGLDEGELMFYDAVAANESARELMGTDKLSQIARELVRAIRQDITVDWNERAQARARMRTIVKRLLAKHGYPPDASPGAIDLVLEQTKTVAEDWAPKR